MRQYFSDLLCFAHLLQLAINDAVFEIDGMVNMLDKC